MDINMIRILQAVASNNNSAAKKYARALLEANNKKCDEAVKNQILPKLNINIQELPCTVRGLVNVEDVESIFKHNRYVTTKEDRRMVKRILDTWNVREKLCDYGIKYSNSLLLHGAPGCGKTMLGKYISFVIELPFLYLNFSNLISSYLGKTGENLQKVFNYIEDNPCVLMLDELDAIGLERGQNGDVGEMNRIVINLMQCLDKINNNCIVVGATNRIDMIDKALLRRFTNKYEIKKPTEDFKKEIVRAFLKTIPNNCPESDIDKFVSKGETCAEITNLLIDRTVECLVKKQELTLREAQDE